VQSLVDCWTGSLSNLFTVAKFFTCAENLTLLRGFARCHQEPHVDYSQETSGLPLVPSELSAVRSHTLAQFSRNRSHVNTQRFVLNVEPVLDNLETLETQICALMDTMVEEAVAELGRLLAAQQCPSPATVCAVKSEEEEREVTPPGERHLCDNTITNQFASLMEARTRAAVEKILTLLKVSLCEAAEQRAGRKDENKQKKKRKAGQVAAPKKPDSDTHESNSGTPSEPGAASEPEVMEQEVTEQEVTEQAVTEPEVMEQEVTEQEVTEQEVTEQEVTEQEVTEQEMTEQAVTEPEVTEQEVTEQKVTEPEVTEPEVTEHDVVQEDTGPSTIKPTKKSTGPFKCPSCDKQFRLKCWMDRHYRTHSKPHLCSECGKGFVDQRMLIAHSRKHTGEKPYECSDCGTEFAYKSTFKRHMLNHSLKEHSLKETSFHTCSLCEKQFEGLVTFQRHRCCALKKTFNCSLCLETFTCSQSLVDHEQLHAGARYYVCEVCGERFFSISSLATHRVCGKGCSHQSALNHHMLTHTGDKPYVCETCGKRCGHSSALVNHMRVHTGKKPGKPVSATSGNTRGLTCKKSQEMD
ncbi:Zinc finger protein 16, partial [Dissostichus eleginoides]